MCLRTVFLGKILGKIFEYPLYIFIWGNIVVEDRVSRLESIVLKHEDRITNLEKNMAVISTEIKGLKETLDLKVNAIDKKLDLVVNNLKNRVNSVQQIENVKEQVSSKWFWAYIGLVVGLVTFLMNVVTRLLMMK